MVRLLICGISCKKTEGESQMSGSLGLFVGTNHILLKRTITTSAESGGVHTWLLVFLEQSKPKWLWIVSLSMPTFTSYPFLIRHLSLSFYITLESEESISSENKSISILELGRRHEHLIAPYINYQSILFSSFSPIHTFCSILCIWFQSCSQTDKAL